MSELKYLEGTPIKTIAEFAEAMERREYIINATTKQRINPSWAMSWQFRMCADGIRKGVFLRAIPNPEHPDFAKDRA
jgi:hypothetical protein